MADEERIWIVTDEIPEKSVADGSKGGNNTGGSWGDETRTG
ncbi:MAG: hypothetical protein QNJ47_04290 [Nostocaceae cyanobacterium]|nr:hypothetical protein [Nostocaceae cyanobacterium]